MRLVLTNNLDNYDNSYTVLHDASMIEIMVCDSEATEIIIDSFLSNIRVSQFEEFMRLILSKLRIGGKIVISDLDIELLSGKLFMQQIDVNEFNQVLFDSSKSVCSLHNLENIKNILKKYGIDISSSSYYNYFFTLTGVRNV